MKSNSASVFFALLLLVLLPLHARSADQSPVPNEDQFLSDVLWDYYRAIPDKPKINVGLALGGGGARGLAHIGVLKVFEQEGVPVDRIAGTSVGALIGSLYAAGSTTEDLEQMAHDIGWSSLTNYSNLSMVRLIMLQTLLSSDRMESYLRQRMGDIRFDQLKIPFVCAATDLQTGERVVFREGLVVPAARASATIPGLFSPVVFRHRYLVDGGLVSNLPTDLVRSIGADIVVASDVSSDYSSVEPKNVFSTITQAVYIQGQQINRENRRLADVVITPKLENISPTDLTRSAECIDAGSRAARNVARDVKRILIDRLWPQIWRLTWNSKP
jgi:NTE family protein